MKNIKTSTHSLKDLNSGKFAYLNLFLEDYSNAVKFYVNYLWNNEIIYSFKSGNKTFNIKKDLLDCPSFIYYVDKSFQTKLSARALSSAMIQACGIVSSALEKRRRLLYTKEKLKQENKSLKQINKLLQKTKLLFPNLSNICAELSSKNSLMEISHISHFDMVITLKSIGKEYGKIIIPIKCTKHSRKLEENRNLMNSILVSKNNIHLRWENNISEKKEGITVGADTGINSVITLSDSQQISKDNHNHTLNEILNKISRKQKGSKGFHKALEHRDNFINWSINQLNLENIKEIRLEKVTNFRYKKNVRKFLNYSGEALIREKLKDHAREHGVHVILHDSAYMSQRCSYCGYVYKGNRKGKVFHCLHCSFQADADYNASCNHEINLPSANFLLYQKDKIKEFIWKEDGFFNPDGSEFGVPDTQ